MLFVIILGQGVSLIYFFWGRGSCIPKVENLIRCMPVFFGLMCFVMLSKIWINMTIEKYLFHYILLYINNQPFFLTNFSQMPNAQMFSKDNYDCQYSFFFKHVQSGFFPNSTSLTITWPRHLNKNKYCVFSVILLLKRRFFPFIQ